MRIRRATARDAAEMGEGMAVVADEGRWLATPAGTPAAALTARFASAMEDGHVLFAAIEEARIVGCLGLHPALSEGVLNLGMWLLPAARGRGGGRLLMEAACDHATEQGVPRIDLEVFADNPRAVALYEGIGFRHTGQRPARRRVGERGAPLNVIGMSWRPPRTAPR